MDEPKQSTNSQEEDERFLSRLYRSKEEFVEEYQRFYHGKAKAKDLYFLILTELQRAISKGNIDKFKRFVGLIEYIDSVESPATLEIFHTDSDNPIKKANFVILACKHDKINILNYVFSNSRLLFNLFRDVRKNSLEPGDRDEDSHDAFYYAIRSGNTDLLDILISQWPGDYFSTRSEELDEVLSKTYEELKFRNISLSNEMGIFVENKLIGLRFFSNPSGLALSAEDCLSNISERVDLVLENIVFLEMEYSNGKKVDERFLFVARFIVQNVHVLKRQLRLTYDRLPWEEIEFCLVTFISCYIKKQEINLYYCAILNKDKLLLYLKNFAKKLKTCQSIVGTLTIDKLADLPTLKREEVVARIISDNAQFADLYADYQQIRDIYSLEKINAYLNLALSIDPIEKEGQLIIIRALQVMGEYLKNTLEFPNLCATASEFILMSLPKNTRKIIIGLRNSFSHVDSLSKRIEIEENADVDFFIGIQKDTKRLGDLITDILYNSKIKMIRILLNEIANNKSLEKIRAVAQVLNNVEVDTLKSPNSATSEHQKLVKLFREWNAVIPGKTQYEKDILRQINNIIKFAEDEPENISADYKIAFNILQGLSVQLSDNTLNQSFTHNAKIQALNAFESSFPRIEYYQWICLLNFSTNVFHSLRKRIYSDLDVVNRPFFEVYIIAQFGMNNADLKWIEKLREKICDDSFISLSKPKKTLHMTDDEYDEQLTRKLSKLKSIFKKTLSNGKLIENMPTYCQNRNLLTVVEMLVLDIMSILDRSEKYMENNFLFLDDNAPLLTGKCLCNHLTHGNVVLNMLLSNPSTAVLLNAEKLISENVVTSEKKIGKLVRDDPSKLKNEYDRSLIAIANQEEMFSALENGNLEELKTTLRNGADINARSINSWTSLHFAASGPSLAVVKFVLDSGFDVNVKDCNGQSLLHIAATHGRTNLVKFFVEELAIPVNNADKSKRTPLHLAAKNGHKDIVEILLKNNANTNIKDAASCYSPLYYAMQNNHVDVFKILLDKEADINANEVTGGYTLLHLAAEWGHAEMVDILLERGAYVDAKDDKGGTALHAATIRGHLEIVNTLIRHGAHVNIVLLDGSTALLYAAQFNREKIAEVLLEHRAKVNAVDRFEKVSALHHAARNGSEEIVEMLLKKQANVHSVTAKDFTPLHGAALKGHMKTVASLLNYGSDIRARCKNKHTPLHLAAESGHKEITQLLIKKGAEVNPKAYDLSTPLYLAARNGHADVVDLLVKNKAKIDIRDKDGNTPVLAAAVYGHKDVIEVLVKSRVNINVKTNDGWTPLHSAAQAGHHNVVAFLVQNKAELEAKTKDRSTPLQAAVHGGHKEVVELLISNGAKVNVTSTMGKYCSPKYVNSDSVTPLHVAVEICNKEIVEILVRNGANVNAESGGLTPLHLAIQNRSKEIVEILLENGAIVDHTAVMIPIDIGYKEMFDILLRKLACVNLKGENDETLLHCAANRRRKKMVNALIASSAEVNAVNSDGVTPLFMAARHGDNRIVDILIANGADVNFNSIFGTPLFAAVNEGHNTVVDILLCNGTDINLKLIKNERSYTALKVAVSAGHVSVMKTILQHREIDLNTVVEDDWPLLLIAAQDCGLEMVQFLVDQGCDLRATNKVGSKCIHIAAIRGHINIIEYLLTKGLDINELGTDEQTPLHYAVLNDQPEVIKFLIAKGANVNARDAHRQAPMHIAASAGFCSNVGILLENGAICDALDRHSYKPFEIFLKKNHSDEYMKTQNHDQLSTFLIATEALFHAVNLNKYLGVEEIINKGASINAKFTDVETTSLHHAASKGYTRIVDILLKNKADPNLVCKDGFTPLHYAAKFSHLKCIKALLCHGAIYNAVSNNGKVPSDFIEDKAITGLMELIDESFEKIKNCNVRVIEELNNIKDRGTLKIVMNARNRENKTLIAAAANVDLSLCKQLKNVSQDDVSAQMDEALNLIPGENYQRGFNMLKKLYNKRKAILGADNPAVLEIQAAIARGQLKQGCYKNALDLYEEVLVKQKNLLGLDSKDTLDTWSSMALVMQKMGKEEEALSIYQEVHPKQREILGPTHEDTMTTHSNMAEILFNQKKYDEVLPIYKFARDHLKDTLGPLNRATITAQDNIAIVLSMQGKNEEAFKIFEEVLERKKLVLGSDHLDTLKTLHNIAAVHVSLKKHQEALKIYQEILDIQKKLFPSNHLKTLDTQFDIGNVYFDQGKFISALKAYKECIDQRITFFGPEDLSVAALFKKIELISVKLKLEGSDPSEMLHFLQRDMNFASSGGDVRKVERLLREGADVDDRDIDGRSPLHFAVSSGHLDVVNILLEHGADVTQATNKGNTPLHTATSKGHTEIVQVLLEHVSRDRLSDFVNAKSISSGAASIHIAVQNKFSALVKCLLHHNAIYNIANEEGKRPIDLAEDEEIVALLKLIDYFFEGAEKGHVEVVSKLKTLKPSDFLLVTNARNNQSHGLLQVAIVNKRKDIVSSLLQMLKKSNQ